MIALCGTLMLIKTKQSDGMLTPNPKVETTLLQAVAHKFTCGDLDTPPQLLRFCLYTRFHGQVRLLSPDMYN